MAAITDNCYGHPKEGRNGYPTTPIHPKRERQMSGTQLADTPPNTPFPASEMGSQESVPHAKLGKVRSLG